MLSFKYYKIKMGSGVAKLNMPNTQNKLIKDKDLYREAFGSELRVVKGLKVGDDEKKVTNLKTLNKKYPRFREELWDHADESGPVKPWLCQIMVNYLIHLSHLMKSLRIYQINFPL